jgi:hypothetical protein
MEYMQGGVGLAGSDVDIKHMQKEIKNLRLQDENLNTKLYENVNKCEMLERSLLQEIGRVMNSETFKRDYSPSSLIENQLFDLQREFTGHRDEMVKYIGSIKRDLEWDPNPPKSAKSTRFPNRVSANEDQNSTIGQEHQPIEKLGGGNSKDNYVPPINALREKQILN